MECYGGTCKSNCQLEIRIKTFEGQVEFSAYSQRFTKSFYSVLFDKPDVFIKGCTDGSGCNREVEQKTINKKKDIGDFICESHDQELSTHKAVRETFMKVVVLFTERMQGLFA